MIKVVSLPKKQWTLAGGISFLPLKDNNKILLLYNYDSELNTKMVSRLLDKTLSIEHQNFLEKEKYPYKLNAFASKQVSENEAILVLNYGDHLWFNLQEF